MPYPFPADVQQKVAEQIASGRYSSEDDVIRDALRALTAEAEDFLAVQEAIAEWQAGDQGTPLEEAFEQVRRSQTSERPE
ncbi:MAG: hypothetical protein Tsb009_04640 [Planctomycetaceae bacterium]